MCRRNCVPRPAPSLAPSMRPGMSATTKLTSSGGSPATTTPRFGCKRGERIIGDLGTRRRDARDQRALAGVGIADQADIGQQLQLQAQVALFAGLAFFMLARRLMDRGCEARVAASAATAASNDDTLVGMREVVHQFAGDFVVDDGADRNLQDDALALAAGLVGAFAVTAALGLVFGIEAEVHQRVVALAGFHDDVAAVPAVAARGPAARHEFLATEGHAAVAAVAGLDSNFGFVNEHGKEAISIASN